MRILFGIPEVLQAKILTEWMALKEVGRLDSAVCNSKLRPEYLKLFQIDGCTFSNCRKYAFHPEWILSRGIRCREIILPDLERTLRKEFLQYLNKSSVDCIVVDTDTYKDCCTTVYANGAYTKKIFGSEMETLWLDLAEFCPDIKDFELGNMDCSTRTFTDAIHTLFCRFLSTCGQVRNVTLNWIVNLPALFLEAICSAPCLEVLHLTGCTLLKDERKSTTLFFRKSASVTSFVCSNDTVCMCMLFPFLQTLKVNSITDADALAATHSCLLLTTVTLNFAYENEISKVDRYITGKWPLLKTLCVKLLLRKIALPELLAMKIIANSSNLVAITPMSTYQYATTYPLNYKGSRLIQLNMCCDDAASLATIIVECPYLHTLYLEQGDHIVIESSVIVTLVEQSLHLILGTNIKVLSLSKYDSITNNNLLPLVNASLHTFRLEKCNKLTNKGILQLLPSMPHLRTIEIHQCALVTHDLVVQLPRLCTKLRSFTFVNQHCYSCSHVSTAPKLFSTLLHQLYPSVIYWNVVC